MTDMSKGFTLARLLDATPEQVWRAWTDHDAVAQWWHPEGARTPRESVEIDLREGGSYRYSMVNEEDGTTVITGGTYLEVIPHSRLSFTWGEPGSDPADTPVVTLTLAPEGDRTRLTFELRGVAGQAGDGYFYDGWVSTLDSLAAFV